MFNTPLDRSPQLKANIGLYAQDQWSHGKFTLSGGIRWEYLSEAQDAIDRAAGRFAPAAHYEAINCDTLPGMTCWSSWSPRVGAAYDLFGNGKTALKFSYGKYMTPDSSAFLNLFNPVASLNENRTWNDTNGDDIAQDNEIGASSNPNFGKITGRTLDPNFSREFNTQYSAGVQHELRPGMAATFNWYRRTLHNTAFTRNRAIDPSRRLDDHQRRQPARRHADYRLPDQSEQGDRRRAGSLSDEHDRRQSPPERLHRIRDGRVGAPAASRVDVCGLDVRADHRRGLHDEHGERVGDRQQPELAPLLRPVRPDQPGSRGNRSDSVSP